MKNDQTLSGKLSFSSFHQSWPPVVPMFPDHGQQKAVALERRKGNFTKPKHNSVRGCPDWTTIFWSSVYKSSDFIFRIHSNRYVDPMISRAFETLDTAIHYTQLLRGLRAEDRDTNPREKVASDEPGGEVREALPESWWQDFCWALRFIITLWIRCNGDVLWMVDEISWVSMKFTSSIG